MGNRRPSRKTQSAGAGRESGSGARFQMGGENAMAVTLNQKRALFLGLGVLIVLVLMNLAWAQIASGLGPCFSSF
jgi:hypothetical protein